MANAGRRIWSWLARSKDALTTDDVIQRLEKIEHALDLRYIHKPQAEITQASGTAAAQLIASLEKTPQAVIQIGTVLLIKLRDSKGQSTVIVRTLNMRQMMMLERNVDLMTRPLELIAALGEVGSEDADT